MPAKAILTSNKELVARWVLARIKGGDIIWEQITKHDLWYETLGTWSFKDRRLLGGAIYRNYKRGERVADIEMDAAGEPGWLMRGFVADYFRYPFTEQDLGGLGATRITLLVSKKNKHTRKFVQRLGFVEEGNAREAMSNGDDAMIYGMLKRDCRWIDSKGT